MPRGFGPLEALGEDACTTRMGDDDVHWLALRIALPGVPFSVDGPPELVERLAVLGERLGAAAREAGQRARTGRRAAAQATAPGVTR